MRPERICGPPCRVTRPALPCRVTDMRQGARGVETRNGKAFPAAQHASRLARRVNAARRICGAQHPSDPSACAAAVSLSGCASRAALRLREPGRPRKRGARPPTPRRLCRSPLRPVRLRLSVQRPPSPSSRPGALRYAPLPCLPSAPAGPHGSSPHAPRACPPARTSRARRRPRPGQGRHRLEAISLEPRGDKPRASSGLSPLIAIDSRR